VTTTAQAREAVVDRLITAAVLPVTAIALDNEAFEAPTDGSSWIRLVVRNTASEQETLGAPGQRKFERRAVVFAQIFVPVDVGANNPVAAISADGLAATVRNLFEGVSFGGCNFYGSLIREGRADGRWWLVVVEAPFTYYEEK